MNKELKNSYEKEKLAIKQHLTAYNKYSEGDMFAEFLFCLLTPQSNAEKCWEAVSLLHTADNYNEILDILRSRTRFYRIKTKRIVSALLVWQRIKMYLSSENKNELRNWIACTVYGYGLKEAGHFLRNIGQSDNKIAILDRHILRNLAEHGVIQNAKIKNEKHYLETEQTALAFAEKTGIPMDDLDLLFWHNEHGKYFK